MVKLKYRRNNSTNNKNGVVNTGVDDIRAVLIIMNIKVKDNKNAYAHDDVDNFEDNDDEKDNNDDDGDDDVNDDNEDDETKNQNKKPAKFK
ncbi:hypothetical protein ElyMa_004588900 [Elysia marginata]|uniref:Uncharacterized protein n=1 Tax=Elysia marginata TaxID=1093978 RepID=A0AAV4HVL9_9GAST|nr:hypothetical protein ElyMa_004588900 [Elysia marginata]